MPFRAGHGAQGVRRRLILGCLLALACASALAQQPREPAALAPELRARVLWEAGYGLHLRGNYEGAIETYRASIAAHPTAEAHTFLGWALSHLGKLDEAIAQCKIAIPLDPDFGNPYNDIGVNLMALGRLQEAVPWLEKAIKSKRYCCYQFPHYNLGRVLLSQGKIEEAKRSFERAIDIDPQYLPALDALQRIHRSKLRGI